MKNNLPHLMWVGFVGTDTGLGRVTEHLLSGLLDHSRVTVVALNRPRRLRARFTVVPGQFLHDHLGTVVARHVCQDDPPDLVLLYMDAGPTVMFLDSFTPACPVIAYMPCDAENIMDAYRLDALAHAVFLTHFGLQEARVGGYTGPASVIGHGVDLDLYHPIDQQVARATLGLPPHLFLFGAVATNQPRKRWDLTLYAWKLFLEQTHATDAYLYCHTTDVGTGWDLLQLADTWGIQDQVLLPMPPLAPEGLPEALMPCVYSALDVQISTTQGEGFGLTTLEGLACGVPHIVPHFAALAEWPGDAVLGVSATMPSVTTGCTNLVGWCVNPWDMARAMEELYRFPARRARLRARGLALVQEPQFRWDGLAGQMQDVLAAHGPRAVRRPAHVSLA